jgi:regulator of protease activity HflC (stomatin/prohibitin superfamily)
MEILFPLIAIVFVVIVLGLRIVQQYEKGVVFRLGKIVGIKEPGLNVVIPFIDQLRKVDFRTITLPVPSQKIITKDNVSVDVSAVAYYRIVDGVKSIVAIENVMAAINQIAQTSVRNIVGKFQLDEILSERETINREITKVLDAHTEPWGVIVPVVEIKDIELPEGMQRAMAKQAEAERERRAKIIAAEGEQMSAQKLGEAADIISAHPIALQLRNLQVLTEIAVEKNSTIIFPSQFMDTVQSVKDFIAKEVK